MKMTCLEFYNKLESMNGEEYIKNFLIYNTSLVIAKVKPAATITFKKYNRNLYSNWGSMGKAFIQSIGLDFIELRESDDSIVVLIYNQRLLEKYIGKEENKEFLIGLGYSENPIAEYHLNKEMDKMAREKSVIYISHRLSTTRNADRIYMLENGTIIEYLNVLKNRYKEFNCPHELGIFLGIPINDVKDFINCNDKKCLLCGYWKVYNDCISAQRIFQSYDQVKEYTVNSIFKGIEGSTLVQSIENNFSFYG